MRTKPDVSGSSDASSFGVGIAGHSNTNARGRQFGYEVCDGGICFFVGADEERHQTLTAYRDGVELWSTLLRHERPNHLAAVVADPVLVVLARRRSRDASSGGGLIALGIDPSTGRERWEHAIGHDRVRMLHFNGRHVVVSQRILLALDPTTGDETWRVGR